MNHMEIKYIVSKNSGGNDNNFLLKFLCPVCYCDIFCASYSPFSSYNFVSCIFVVIYSHKISDIIKQVAGYH